MKRYTFVDFATQGYIALVAGLVLFFHGDRLPVWLWLLLVHVAGFGLIHVAWTLTHGFCGCKS